MISNEAVEIGARLLIEDGRYGVPWEDASEDDRAESITRARAILEAAAPHIVAAALRDAADELEYGNPINGWLYDRADELEEKHVV